MLYKLNIDIPYILKEIIDVIKGGLYQLGKNQENLTELQKEKLNHILKHFPKVKAAYNLKENLRKIFKLKDSEQAKDDLNKWIKKADDSGIDAFKQLSEKISRHKENIANTIKFGVSNARIEATNNIIKGIIRRAYGYKKVDNLIKAVTFTCTNKFDNLISSSLTTLSRGNWRQATLL